MFLTIYFAAYSLISHTAGDSPSSDPNDIEGHEFAHLKAHVEAFYDFWYNFDSWRSFEWLDKEVNEGSDRCAPFLPKKFAY